MQKYKKELVLILFALILAGPVLYHGLPLYSFMPDIQFVKAKTLHVAAGDLYADPVTGFPTFHPPFYHLFLSFFTKLGIGINALLLMVSFLNTALIILMTFKLLSAVLGEQPAFIASLLLPFIIRFMGPGYLLLATAFYFSAPFYMTGLWLFLKERPGGGGIALIGLLWGLAFLLSPGYLFLIGFTFGYLLIKGQWRRFGIMVAVFLATISPFFIQAYAIYGSGMAGTTAFAFGRGWPGIEWLQNFIFGFLSPALGQPGSWPVIVATGLALAGVFGMRSSRPVHFFPIVAAAALIFTAYHFNYQYASRIQFFLSLFLAGYGIRFLLSLKVPRIVPWAAIAILIGFGLADHLVRTWDMASAQREQHREFRVLAAGLHEHLSGRLEADYFVLATDYTYRNFIMPYYAVHALMAYKTGEYFQLNSLLAEEMKNDYRRLMGTDDIGRIERHCRKYRIRTAVVGERSEKSLPVFRTIALHWPTTYRDDFFRVYRCPDRVFSP